MPVLIALVRDRDFAMRCVAVWSLDRIGPAAKVALPALRQLQREEGDSILYPVSVEGCIAAIEKPAPTD